MPSYHKISKGIGRLTPDLWARIMKMLRSYESGGVASEKNEIAQKTGLHRPYFLAKITDSDLITGESNRYEYDWTEVVLDDEEGFAVRENGRSGVAALNLCEMSNTAANVAPAIDMDAAGYPASFSMRPIGDCIDDVQLDVIVVMYAVRDSSGTLRSVFSLANDHDGSCS